jgi:hypothetical protein
VAADASEPRSWLEARGLPVALALVLATGLGGCGDDDSSSDQLTLSDDAVIDYRYDDASVPPEHHRSYTLTIQWDEVHVVVDSYGDVLHDTTAPLPPEVWQGLATEVTGIAGLDVDEVDGCSGGTNRSVTVTDGDDTIVDLDVPVCGDSNTETADRIDAYLQPVRDAIADWDALLS